MKREELVDYLDGLLVPGKFRDYCPNGLQVEGRVRFVRLVAGVTASQALLDAAVTRNADAILVHHGYFWKGEDGRVTGIRRQRLATLLAHDINLLAYHLPLDAHPELGNNAQLGQKLGLNPTGRFGDQDLGWIGELSEPVPLSAFADRVSRTLQREPLALGKPDSRVRRVAWCSGGAQGFFHEAAGLDIDCFLTGEASEFVTHLAAETGISFLAAGHHATERHGVAALGAHLAEKFGIEHEYIDVPNPV